MFKINDVVRVIISGLTTVVLEVVVQELPSGTTRNRYRLQERPADCLYLDEDLELVINEPKSVDSSTSSTTSNTPDGLDLVATAIILDTILLPDTDTITEYSRSDVDNSNDNSYYSSPSNDGGSYDSGSSSSDSSSSSFD